jgi:hypothetical protein
MGWRTPESRGTYGHHLSPPAEQLLRGGSSKTLLFMGHLQQDQPSPRVFRVLDGLSQMGEKSAFALCSDLNPSEFLSLLCVD